MESYGLSNTSMLLSKILYVRTFVGHNIEVDVSMRNDVAVELSLNFALFSFE